MKRRFYAVIALLLLLLLSLPAATEELHETDSGVVYTVENGEVTVVGWEVVGYTLDIPAEIDGMPVTKIGRTAFSEDQYMTAVTLPDSIVEIGEDAFAGCKNLRKVTLPKTLDTIPIRCFRFSKVLKEVVMPETLSVIEANAFEGCLMLETVVIPASVKEIGHDAFSGCGSLVLDCTASPLGEAYAAENGLYTLKTVTPSPLPKIILLTAILAVLVIAAELVIRISKKKKKAESK